MHVNAAKQSAQRSPATHPTLLSETLSQTAAGCQGFLQLAVLVLVVVAVVLWAASLLHCQHPQSCCLRHQTRQNRHHCRHQLLALLLQGRLLTVVAQRRLLLLQGQLLLLLH